MLGKCLRMKSGTQSQRKKSIGNSVFQILKLCAIQVFITTSDVSIQVVASYETQSYRQTFWYPERYLRLLQMVGERRILTRKNRGGFWGEAGGLNLSDWNAQLHKDTHLHTLKCTFILLHSWECQDCGDASRSETLTELYDSALEVCDFPSVGSSFCWS